MSRIILPSRFKNLQREIVTDKATGETRVVVHEDLSYALKEARDAKSADPKGHFGDKRDGDWRRVAHLPLTVINRIREESGIDLLGMQGQDIDADQWDYLNKKYLNNGDYKAFRTNEGRV